MSDLVTLLTDLGADAELAQEYRSDPESVLGRYDLTDAQRAAMMEKDVETVKELSGLPSVHLTHGIVKSTATK